MSCSPTQPIRECFSFIQKIQSIPRMMYVARGRPSVFTIQQASHSARGPEASGDHWNSGVYFRNFQLPGALDWYGINVHS